MLRLVVACVLAVATAVWSSRPANAGPDEALLGRDAGYPIGNGRTWFFDESVRVGSFSNLDRIRPYNTLRKAAAPSPLPVADQALRFTYRFDNKTLSVQDFLDRQRITGLMIVKDGKVLAEHYQYDRNARHRFVSHSMAKSIVALAIGFLVEEKKIRSLDDKVSVYVPALAGSAYGSASVRDTLRMASGVKFSELYDGKDDLARFSQARVTDGTIAALKQFTEREAAPGTRFKYATSETVVLAALIRAVSGESVSAYLTPRLWQPMGAEADATWIKNPDGLEVGGGSFNAVLRDYARLGVLLANDGALGGKQVLPKDYLLEATDWKRQPEAFHPAKATNFFGYGYQFWLFPGEKRRFALLGVYGQSIFVDPELKLTLIITAVAKNASVAKESLAGERTALWRGLVAAYGAW